MILYRFEGEPLTIIIVDVRHDFVGIKYNIALHKFKTFV